MGRAGWIGAATGEVVYPCAGGVGVADAAGPDGGGVLVWAEETAAEEGGGLDWRMVGWMDGESGICGFDRAEVGEGRGGEGRGEWE